MYFDKESVFRRSPILVRLYNKCYEKLADKTGVNMLFCHDKDDEDGELLQLCICQRYCDQKEKYIPYNQKQGCKSYL